MLRGKRMKLLLCSFTLLHFSLSSPICDIGDVLYATTTTVCLKVLHESVTWDEAVKGCRSFSFDCVTEVDEVGEVTGELVSIHNAFQNEQIMSLVPETKLYWIGLHSLHSDFYGDTKFYWTDGSKVDYTYQQLKPSYSDNNGVYISWKVWDIDNSTVPHDGYVCQYDMEPLLECN